MALMISAIEPENENRKNRQKTQTGNPAKSFCRFFLFFVSGKQNRKGAFQKEREANLDIHKIKCENIYGHISNDKNLL